MRPSVDTSNLTRRPKLFHAGALCLLAFATVHCGGRKEYNPDPEWRADNEPLRANEGEDRAEAPRPKVVEEVGFSWVGVRHDLTISPTLPRQQRCHCLAVEVGPPYDKRFAWTGTPPEVGPGRLAVAISSVGLDCPDGPKDPADRRPSISAIDRVGQDVVIEVEQISEERPLATGAIIAAPDSGGHLYVKPKNKRSPYGRTQGGPLCRVEIPGRR